MFPLLSLSCLNNLASWVLWLSRTACRNASELGYLATHVRFRGRPCSVLVPEVEVFTLSGVVVGLRGESPSKLKTLP